MFHGTFENLIKKISITSFNEKFSSAGLFGNGIYFAEHPMKSHGYTHENEDGYRFMVITRVLLGEIFLQKQTNSAIKQPPCKICFLNNKEEYMCKLHGGSYDSILGNRPYREFIIYHSTQAIPDFIVKYKYNES